MTTVYVFFVVTLLSIFSVTVRAQTGCEANNLMLRSLISDAKPDDIVIAISHLGRRETQQRLSARRLHNIREYLLANAGGDKLTERQIVMAIGEKSDSHPRVELYFRGQLFAVFEMANNKDLLVGRCALNLEVEKSMCDFPEQQIYYPCMKPKPTIRKTRRRITKAKASSLAILTIKSLL